MQKTPKTAQALAPKQTPPNGPRPSDLSYRHLRRGVGVIGMALPFVLLVGKWLFESIDRGVLQTFGPLDSISGYYYSVMRDEFVGGLCAMAVFLLFYRYERRDNYASFFAGVCAIGVVLCPTAPMHASGKEMFIGYLHLAFSAAFLLLLAYFALCLFTKKSAKPTKSKERRNVLYRVCGWAILFFLVLDVVAQKLFADNMALQAIQPVYWTETLAVVAFGVAWLVKGETVPFLNDKAEEDAAEMGTASS
jgi:hypothetical protein